MEDALDLYERRVRGGEPVVCLDEKPLQLLEDARPVRGGPRCGRIQQRDYEYRRRGVVNIFCALEPNGGCHFYRVARDRSAGNSPR